MGAIQHHVDGASSIRSRSDASAEHPALAAQAIADAVTTLRDEARKVSGHRQPGVSSESGGVYLARDPVVSLVQSVLEEHLRPRTGPVGYWDQLVMRISQLLDPGRFTPDDPNWVIKIAEAMLTHLAIPVHPFNQQPAVHPITDDARLVLVGDWGTGLRRARDVAALMAIDVAEGRAAGRDVHVIHLGDVYYSGLRSEYRHHALDLWPVTDQQAADGVTSWSLNGNHDMYSGGHGYFRTMLADPRFSLQQAPDREPTSYFRLVSPSWDFVGLDTAWRDNRLSKGLVGVLQNPQAQFVNAIAEENPQRKLGFLSHHQYISVYSPEDIGTELGEKLAPTLDARKVTAWWWGHEHRCMGFEASGGVRFPRCIGHGGVPTTPLPEGPIPKPGTWLENTSFIEDNQCWTHFGYAVLDLDGDRIDVRYRNDDGTTPREEEVS